MIVSFGYKNGAPKIDKLFDIRDLSHDTESPDFLARTSEIVAYAKSHPTERVGVGCEKGHHRSRVMVNRIATQARTSAYHRDL